MRRTHVDLFVCSTHVFQILMMLPLLVLEHAKQARRLPPHKLGPHENLQGPLQAGPLQSHRKEMSAFYVIARPLLLNVLS